MWRPVYFKRVHHYHGWCNYTKVYYVPKAHNVYVVKKVNSPVIVKKYAAPKAVYVAKKQTNVNLNKQTNV